MESLLGRHERASILAGYATQAEPSSAHWVQATVVRLAARDYAGALEVAERVRSTGDEMGYRRLRAQALFHLGREQEALAEIMVLDNAFRDVSDNPGQSDNDIDFAFVRCALGNVGALEEYRPADISDPLTRIRFSVALSTCRGELDNAFSAIQQLMDIGANVFFNSEPFDVLREDPRWLVVEQYMNLPGN